jgi:hypothetical protein
MRALGNAVYWIACGIVALIVLLAVYYLLGARSFEGGVSGDDWLHAISFGLLALPVWFVGWVIRRVLAKS